MIGENSALEEAAMTRFFAGWCALTRALCVATVGVTLSPVDARASQGHAHVPKYGGWVTSLFSASGAA